MKSDHMYRLLAVGGIGKSTILYSVPSVPDELKDIHPLGRKVSITSSGGIVYEERVA